MAAAVAGRLRLYFIFQDGSTAPTTPSGYTQIFSGAGNANACRLTIIGKVLTGSESTSQAITMPNESGGIYGVDYIDHGVTTVSSDVKAGTVATGASVNPNPSSLDPGSAKDWLYEAAYAMDLGGPRATAYPSGYSNGVTNGAGGSTGADGAIANKAGSGSQVEDAGAFTSDTSDDWAAVTIAIPPAAGGTTQTINVGGGLTPAGDLSKQPNKNLAAGLTPAGTLTKQTIRTFTAALTTAGALSKFMAKRIVGSLTPAGTLTNSKLSLKSFAGSFTPSGILIRQPQKQLTGTLTTAGALKRDVSKFLAGTLATAGALRKIVSKTFSGTLATAGSVANLAVKNIAIAGTLTTAGAIMLQTQKRFTGTLTPTGTLLKQLQRRFTGTLTTAGTVGRLAVKTLSVGGVLAPTGTLLNQVRKTLTGTLTSSGALTKMPARRFTGTLGTAGAVANQKTMPTKFLTGTLTFTGTLRKSLSRTFTGSLAPTGTLTKQIARRFSGALSFIGNLVAVVIGPPTGSIAILIELRSILAAALPTARVDLSGAQPFTYEPDCLYLWEDTDARTPLSQGRMSFAYMAVIGTRDQGEQARQIGDRDVTTVLQARATAMMNALRSNVSGSEWEYLTATVDPDFVLGYGVRGFAFRITGYRLG